MFTKCNRLSHSFRKAFLSISLMGLCSYAWAQTPVVKIDFNHALRNVSQVGETGYEDWRTLSNPVSNTYEGVTFTLAKSGDNGKGLNTNWYANGMGYANLVSDGVQVEDGNDGGAILLTISNLETGEHSLLVYLNTVDSPVGNTFCPVDIYVNDVLVENDVVPSNRALSNYDAKMVYLTFSVTAGVDVKILFKADVVAGSTANNKNVMINGIELNTPNLLDQAIEPSPANNNEHVEAENASVNLSWLADDEAVSHNVYISTDEETTANATTSSEAFKGNQSDNVYTATNLDTHLTYYWRIDEVKEDGTTTMGNVWNFRIAQLAFPGAEGYGRFARGGRDGKVVHVTNLNDSGEGSFRYAIEEETGPRTIVFDVSGVIKLLGRLVLSDDYVTIAGQTAPGKGICLRDAPFGLSGANDAIVQNIRVRRGNVGNYNWGLDGMGMQGSSNSIIDHCSISWTIDEAFSSRNALNISLQRTLISEALNVAGHPNYPAGTAHGYAASIGGDVGSFHHNLLAHCEGRNWSLAGGLDGDAYYAGRLDIRNNVVYNWGHRATDGGSMEVNFVNNYYKPGAATDIFYALSMDHEGTGLGTQRAYFAGNVMPGHFDESNQGEGRRYTIKGDQTIVDWETFVDNEFFDGKVAPQTALQAYKNVLSDVGCIQPVLDDHDERMLNETLNGTYAYSGSVSGKAGLPDSQEDVGGWEDYPALVRNAQWDTDGDGLPNWWETAHGLSTDSPAGDYSDAVSDIDADGYTQLDEFLMWMSKPHFIQQSNQTVSINLTKFFRGYTSSPAYEVISQDNVAVEINEGVATITASATGLASVTFKVTDADADTMEKEVHAYFYGEGEGDFNTTEEYVPNAVDEVEGDVTALSVYPNPANGDKVYVSGSVERSEIKSISVLSLDGKVLRREKKNSTIIGEFQETVDISKLTSGVYLLKVDFDNGQKVIRFVIS